MDYRVVKEYINELSLKQLESMKRIVSPVTLRKFIKTIINEEKSRYEAPIWFYIGTKNDHIIVPRLYCSCKYFVIRVMSEKQSLGCIHIVGQKLAEEKGLYRVVEMTHKEYLEAIYEVIKYGRSRIIRKILYSSKTRKNHSKSM
ncbi:MAG: hypothetical protein DRO40_04680 [Thermoprotei archaeon]|nr:MAG: hypothetical protein DRO40_04680 [Thermoprotei archaeon]